MKISVKDHISTITNTIKNSLAMVLPILTIGSITVLLNGFPSWSYQEFIDEALGGALRSIIQTIQSSTVGILAVYLTISLNICYMNRVEEQQSIMFRFGSMLACVTGFLIIVGFFSGDPDFSLLSGQGVFSALLSGLIGSALFLKFEKLFKTRKSVILEGADSLFNTAIHVILPFTAVILCFAFANWLITVCFQVESIQHLFMKAVDMIFLKMHRSYSSGLLFITLISGMWLFGIHGNNVLEQVARDQFIDIIPGEIVSKSFIDTFVNMGGTGCLIGLLIAMLIFGKQRSTKRLSRIALLPNVFNISELIVFGFPVIFNPLMFIPFIASPVICYTNAFLLTKAGFLPPVATEVVWTVPPILSGYIATGSVRGIIVQLMNIALSVACYTPFLILYEKKAQREFSSTMDELVSILKRSRETAEDVVLTQCRGNVGRLAKRLSNELEEALSFAGNSENPLLIKYQPQYDNAGHIIGAESLLCWNHKEFGLIYPPLIVQLAKESGNQHKLEAYTMELLHEEKERADEANEAKSRFLSNMSHEIRTPVNAVLGMNEMIMRTTAEKKTMEYAANIRTSGKALLSIINDILDLSKIESGKMELVPVDYDTASLINDMVNMIRKRAEDKGLSLLVHVDPAVPARLHGDDIRIRQCVTNLLTNAVKYTNEGTVTLDISCEITGDDDNNDTASVFYTVTDTGIGIKQEDMGRLFENFERIEEERNRSIEGTGLGMSITTQLLSMMGTSLDVRSEYGKGSTFSFKVTQKIVDNTPIGDFEKRLSEEIPETGSYHELLTAPEARILVVDDTDMNLVVIRGLLEETLVSVDTAGSGAEALEILADNEYDALFIDHRMPGMDGIELLSRIKENKDDPNSKKPCVALTANAVSGIREMYINAGFDDYLSKPVDPVKLENMLIGMLPDGKVHLYGSEENKKDREKHGECTEKEETRADDRLLNTLSEILGMDIKTALANCGSPEIFKNSYERFIMAIPEKTEMIRGSFEAGDIENYTILVHSLKSSAALVGAMKLSEEAALLEKAGNEKDTEYIRNNTERVMSLYGSFLKGAGDSAKENIPVSDEEKDEMDEESFSEALDAISEFAEAFDLKSASDVLDNIEKEKLTDAMEDKVRSIRGFLRKADSDGLVSFIRG